MENRLIDFSEGSIDLTLVILRTGDIIGAVIDKMQWSVNEQCAEYNECEVYAAFTESTESASVNPSPFSLPYASILSGSTPSQPFCCAISIF
jgi:hypothetical protein